MANMKRLVLFSVLLAVLFTVLPLSAFADAPDIYERARKIARAEIWKDINSGRTGSGAVAIMDNGVIVYSEGFGMADREQSIPVDRNTIFNIGSVSKVFTATAIMLLVDEGKVRLDEPVTTYLPEFKMADPRYKQITVRMLLNHTSGLPGTTSNGDFGIAYNPDFFQQVLGNLAASHLKFNPGAMAPYTNDGFTLAEMVVERVSGQKFIEFLSARVFNPLSMANTGLTVGERPDQIAAAYYQPDGGKKEPLEVLSLIGAGGLSSTAEDLCRFLYSFSGSGTRILSPAAGEEMSRGQPSAFYTKLQQREFSFGLGWDLTGLPRYRETGIQVLGKSGRTSRYSSMMVTAPEHRISVAVLEAGNTAKASEITLKVLDAVLVQKGLVVEKPAPVSRPLSHQPIPARYAVFDGHYAPLKKISFDFKKNMVTLKTLDFGDDSPPVTLFYHEGYFYNPDGQKSYFVSIGGEQYYVSRLEGFELDMIAAQKLKKLSRPQSLRIDVNQKQWLLRNSSWFDGVTGVYSHIAWSQTLAELPGYVDFGGIKLVKSPDFAGMAVGSIRDQTELTLIKRDGTTWARLSEYLFSPVSAAVVFKRGNRSVTIGTSGYSEWLKAGEGLMLSFEKPDHGRVVVYSAQGEPLYDSALDTGNTYAAKGSLIEFAGEPGAVFKIEGK